VIEGRAAGSSCEPPHDIDQLAVSRAGGIAELGFRMCVGKSAQADQLADSLAPIELQPGSPVDQKNAPQLAVAEKVIEF
jgi:hypothetical protein